MANYLIFDNNGVLTRITTSDSKKDAFVTGQPYTAKTVSDADYASVRNVEKEATLSGDTISYSDIPVSYPSDLADIKTTLNSHIADEKDAFEKMHPNENILSILSALDAIDVDAVTEAPTVNPFKWVLDHASGPDKVSFEL